MRFFELSHDILAAKISEMVAPDLKRRREVRAFIESRYQPEQPDSLLNKADLKYIEAVYEELRLPPELDQFVKRSRRAQRNRRYRLIALLSLTVLSLLGAYLFYFFQSQKFEGLYLTATARQQFSTNPTQALRTARKAMNTYPDEVPEAELYRIYRSNRLFYEQLSTHDQAVLQAVYHPQRKRLYFTLDPTEDLPGYYPILAYQLDTRALDTLSRLVDSLRPNYPITELAFSHDSTELVVQTASGYLHRIGLDPPHRHREYRFDEEQIGTRSLFPLPDGRSYAAFRQQQLWRIHPEVEQAQLLDSTLGSHGLNGGVGMISNELIGMVQRTGHLLRYDYAQRRTDSLPLADQRLLAAQLGPDGRLATFSEDGYLAQYQLSPTPEVPKPRWRKAVRQGPFDNLVQVPRHGYVLALRGAMAFVFAPSVDAHTADADTAQYVLMGHSQDISSVAFAEEALITTSKDGSIRRWPLPQTQAVADIPISDGPFITDLHWHPQHGIYVAVGGHVLMGKLQAGPGAPNIQWKDTLEVDGKITAMDLALDGSLVLSTATHIHGYQPNSHAPFFTHEHAPGEEVKQVSLAPDGDRLLSLYAGGTATLWAVSSQLTQVAVLGGAEAITLAAFSPDGTYLAIGTAEGALSKRDLQGREVLSWEASRDDSTEQASLHKLAFSPDGHLLLRSGFSLGAGQLPMLHRASRRDGLSLQAAESIAEAEQVHALLVHPTQPLLMTASGPLRSGQSICRVWETASRRLLRTYPPQPALTQLAAAPDGRYLLVARARSLHLYPLDVRPLDELLEQLFR